MARDEKTALEKSEKMPVQTSAVREFTPNVDVFESEMGIVLFADMPGVSADTLDVRVEKGILILHGATTQTARKGRPAYTEYNEGNFARSFALSDDLDTEKIQASIADGVVRIEIPKAERAKPRRIPVKKV
ncbi:MAG: Hsp20/alpha crystallin family protein [Planctomycetota bacterium]